ncbi:MAG: 1-acyl-sn-glycerol-3-phosphate acyltransferase [Spirochaetales bacterium]|nr:1-acyl-sn-glycerol-3-phosphate acyltransferase [Spirochaetales bacterium]
MDRKKYEDIEPYRGERFEKAKANLMSKKEFIGAFAYMLSGDFSTVAPMVNAIESALVDVHSYDDFQHKVTAGYFIPAILDKTTTGFSVSGGDSLDKNKGYLFISNHRDIILDCTLLDYALKVKNLPLCEMAVGDNLMVNQMVEDLFRMNGGIIIKRNLPMREKYLESIRISEYFVETVSEENKSIWVAQKSGRSKDGKDLTQSAIIKMLYLSKKREGYSFSELMKKCNIVPVAISYQYDPNDINKGREEVTKEHNDGKYEKKKYEDLISMVKGLRCQKGNVHVAIGEPLTGEYNTPEEVAEAIDRQIHLNYRLFDTNYLAYDVLEGGDMFKDQYASLNKDEFLSRFSHLSEDVRSFVLNTYANPVRMMLQAKNGQ